MNTARRQSSTTSLARVQREPIPVNVQSPTPDFCNAFWGREPEKGVDVLLFRMKMAERTLEEVRAFWRERAAIEDDYAKRLAKLSKLNLGRDEFGELRNSLDTLKAETEKQASTHAALAQSMRRELEDEANKVIAKMVHHKRTSQAAIEKAFKTLQAQESFVGKAHDKYKSDCVNINLFTARATLQQGKELEKTQIKLERTKQTVTQNERDYANSVEVFRETCRKWEQDWKGFCDQCQDLDEERIEFLKDNLWSYANCVSTVCVSDDESCEKLRIALEQVEPERDIEYFVSNAATGDEISELPKFHSYADGNASTPPRRVRRSNFNRSSTRPTSSRPMTESPLPIVESPQDYGQAGIGAGGAVRGGPYTAPSVAPPMQSNITGLAPSSTANVPFQPQIAASPPKPATLSNAMPAGPANGHSSPAVAPLSTQKGVNAPRQGQGAPTTTQTQIAIGPNVYDVNPEADPQPSNRGPTSVVVNPTGSSLGDVDDPIAKALEDLKNGNAGGRSLRRGATAAVAPANGPISTIPRDVSRSPSRKPAPIPADEEAPNAPRVVPPPSNLQAAADSIVGPHPASRPSSPVAPQPPSSPQAVFMQQRGPVEPANVVKGYQQSLPGERRMSRQGPALQPTGSFVPNGGNSRPSSPSVPFAGVGAHGRSPSPGLPARVTSPASITPNPAPMPLGGPPTMSSQSLPNANTAASPFNYPEQVRPPSADPRQNQRVTSPTTVGITLDSGGRVRDAFAEGLSGANRFSPGPQQPGPAGPTGQMGWQPQQPLQSFAPGPVAGDPRLRNDLANNGARGTPPARQASFRNPVPANQPPAGPPQPNVQRQNTYSPQPPPLVQQPTQTGPVYGTEQARVNIPPNQPQTQQSYPNQSVQSPPQPTYNNPVTYRSQPPGNYPPIEAQQNQPQYYAPPGGYAPSNQAPPQPPPQPPQQYPPQNQGYGYPAPGNPPVTEQQMIPPPMNPPPQAPITEYLEDGTAVLFYVKALYDYNATIEEEFDFQTGDIIAVTATPEDGWWSGVLLDDVRRVPGRTVFPSNFVCLF